VEYEGPDDLHAALGVLEAMYTLRVPASLTAAAGAAGGAAGLPPTSAAGSTLSPAQLLLKVRGELYSLCSYALNCGASLLKPYSNPSLT